MTYLIHSQQEKSHSRSFQQSTLRLIEDCMLVNTTRTVAGCMIIIVTNYKDLPIVVFMNFDT